MSGDLSLPNPENSLPITIEELQMGDILNRPNYHVILFHEFINQNHTQIKVYESGPNLKVTTQYYTITHISPDRHTITLNVTGSYDLYTYYAGNLS